MNNERVIVMTVRVTPKDGIELTAIMTDIKTSVRELLEEYKNYKFIPEFTISVTEQGHDRA